MDKDIKIIIAGGGTGGHLIPAFAIADAFKKNKSDIQIRFMGSDKGIESKLYKLRSEEYYLLKTIGIKRDFSLKSLYHNFILFPFKLLHASIKAFQIFGRFSPDVVVGTGGYSSAIPLFVALLKGIKIVIQEQNSMPGLVNRIFLRKAQKVFFGFKPVKTDNINYMVSGNPTMINKSKFDINAKKINDQFTIFILGGSQGSAPINNHFLNHYKQYLEKEIRLIWQCGENNIKSIKNQIKSKYIDLHGFINEIEECYLESDLIISRAGALTLTEIANYGKASILIPYPFAANDHQLSNANFYKENNACEIVTQNQLKKGVLEHKVNHMIDNKDVIRGMEKNVSLLSKPNASESIVEEILKICLIKAK